MIYLKNNTETQTIYIPRQAVSGREFVSVIKSYNEGVADGIKIGQQEQKNKLTSLYITEDGVYEREDGYNLVTVDVKNNCPECPPILLEKGNFTAFENGEYVITPTEGFDGLESLNLMVNVPQEGGDCNLEDKLITPSMGDRDENGYVVVEESEGYDGLSRVIINPSTIYNEGVEDGKSQGGTVTTYPTIKDIYNTEDVTTEVYFKATVAVCLQNGSNCYIIVTDHTGAFYVNTNQPYDVGDECIFTGVVSKNSTTNIRFMNRPVVEVISKGNYVVMPTDAVELTTLSDLYTTLNEYGNAEMKYLYFEGEVNKFSSNQIRITTPESVSARGYINLRLTKEEWINDLVIGDYVRIYMFPTNSDGMFMPTDFIKLGTESGDCPELGEITITENGTYEGAYDRVIVDVPQEGGNCNLGDLRTKFEDLDGTGRWWRGANEDELDGYGYVEINANEYGDQKFNQGYEQGYNDGQANCGEGGGCVLEHLEVNENGFYEPKPQEFGYLSVNENSAFDTGVKLVENTTIEIFFNTGDSDSNIPTLIGCEDSDWTNTTFAARWFDGNLSIKIGTQEIYIPIGAEDEAMKFHKLKFGRYEGVWFDDNFIEPFNDTEWILNQNTIFIGAMHNTTNGDANGVWRPWNGYLGNVKIYGEKNGEVRDFTFNCGDFGRWGEYEIEGNILPNIMGDGGATLMCCKQYGDKPFDGYRDVSVNVTPKIRNYEGVKFGNSTFTDCPFNIDEIGNYDYMFLDCKKLVNPPIINTTINSAVCMFNGCTSLVNGGNYDTSNATNLYGMYGSCHNLQYVGSINCSSLPNDIIGWGREAEIFDTLQYLYLTDFGGFINLKQVVNLKGLISLNEQSVINIFNGLYDFVGNNETPNAIQGELTMSRFIADIVEVHKSKAENKGWTIIIE